MGEDVDVTMAHTAMDILETTITDMTSKITVEAMAKQKGTFLKIEDEVKILHFEDDEDNGMVMTLTTMTEITGIGMVMVKIIPIEATDGEVIEVRDIMIGGEGGDGILIHNFPTRIIHNSRIILTPITIAHHQWDINTNTPYHMNNTLHILKLNRNTHHLDCQRNHVKPQIYVNCAKMRSL